MATKKTGTLGIRAGVLGLLIVALFLSGAGRAPARTQTISTSTAADKARLEVIPTVLLVRDGAAVKQIVRRRRP